MLCKGDHLGDGEAQGEGRATGNQQAEASKGVQRRLRHQEVGYSADETFEESLEGADSVQQKISD